MITQRQMLTDLFDSFGIGYDSEREKITIEEGYEKVSGYSGFAAEFNFDNDGGFIDVSIWE
jgi:hypothetical protein